MTAPDGGPDYEVRREAAGEFACCEPPARPRVLGLDLSLTAAAVASSAGWIEVVGESLPLTATYTERLLRVHDVAVGVTNLISPSVTDLVLIEGPAYSRNDPSAFDRAFLWWRIYRYCWSSGIPVAVVTPSQVKLYATGKGTASKGAVIDAVARRWPGYITRGDDNAADAVALLAMGLDHLGYPLAGMPKANRATLAKVAWPDLGGLRITDCTHGAGCPVHPDANAVHNFDAVMPELEVNAAGHPTGNYRQVRHA